MIHTGIHSKYNPHSPQMADTTTTQEQVAVMITGFSRSGKDTVADFWMNHASGSYRKLKFADPLKHATMAALRELHQVDYQYEDVNGENPDLDRNTPMNTPARTAVADLKTLCKQLQSRWTRCAVIISYLTQFLPVGFGVQCLINQSPPGVFAVLMLGLMGGLLYVALQEWHEVQADIICIEKTISRCEGALPQPNTIRKFLQWFGTDIMRTYLGEDVHINAVIPQAQAAWNDGHHIVISDLRFKNENHIMHEQLQSIGFRVIRIRVHRTSPQEHTQSDEQVKLHPTEQDIPTLLVDHVITNDGTMHDLQNAVKAVIRSFGVQMNKED